MPPPTGAEEDALHDADAAAAAEADRLSAGDSLYHALAAHDPDGVRALWRRGARLEWDHFYTMVGLDSDLAAVEMLFDESLCPGYVPTIEQLINALGRGVSADQAVPVHRLLVQQIERHGLAETLLADGRAESLMLVTEQTAGPVHELTRLVRDFIATHSK